MNKRPKIALWFRYGPADHSELFHAMPQIVAALAAHCEVHYYGMKTSTPLPDAIRHNAVIHELPWKVDRTNSRDKLVKTLLWLLALPWVGLHCRLLRVRAVYIDETIPLTTLIARLFYGRNVAVTVADFFTDIYFTGATARLGRALRAMDLWNWKHLPLIFTRAGATRTWLAKQGVDPALVYPVYDPCDLSLYRPLPPDEREAVRKQFGYQPSDIVLVHHGILHPNKGNDRILRALAELRAEFPQLRYLLIGDGTEMGRLRELVRELQLEAVCTLTGWLPTLPDVNRALNAGDIGLVMRTGAESDDFHMTGALVHNMACGLPLLSARLGGVSEVVKEDRNGFLFNPSDMEEFKAKLAQLIRAPEKRIRFGATAAEEARVHFDMQRVTQNTVAPLLRLAGINRPPQAVILLGGRGTRIQSLYGDRPKCLVPVAGQPFLLRQLEWLRRGGITRVHLAAGFMAEVLRDWLKTDAPKDMEITFSVEPEPRGTGGAIKFAEPWIQGDSFFVLNGDSLTPSLDFQALEKAHRLSSDGWITLGVAQIEKTGRYGTVEFDEQERVTAFLEKADRAQGWINTGVYCISRRTLAEMAPDQNVSIETDLFPALVSAGRLRVFRTAPPLLDMGTPDGLAAMEEFLAGHPTETQ
jgi:D-glycero-alpha-D-manno-heptose 1-phosphate guanylyltransferase